MRKAVMVLIVVGAVLMTGAIALDDGLIEAAASAALVVVIFHLARTLHHLTAPESPEVEFRSLQLKFANVVTDHVLRGRRTDIPMEFVQVAWELGQLKSRLHPTTEDERGMAAELWVRVGARIARLEADQRDR